MDQNNNMIDSKPETKQSGVPQKNSVAEVYSLREDISRQFWQTVQLVLCEEVDKSLTVFLVTGLMKLFEEESILSIGLLKKQSKSLKFWQFRKNIYLNILQTLQRQTPLNISCKIDRDSDVEEVVRSGEAWITEVKKIHNTHGFKDEDMNRCFVCRKSSSTNDSETKTRSRGNGTEEISRNGNKKMESVQRANVNAREKSNAENCAQKSVSRKRKHIAGAGSSIESKQKKTNSDV